jgi:hypothetical protein
MKDIKIPRAQTAIDVVWASFLGNVAIVVATSHPHSPFPPHEQLLMAVVGGGSHGSSCSLKLEAL